jgi:LEA14-like dessication related protein
VKLFSKTCRPEKIWLNVITNKANSDVAMDKITGDVFLDQYQTSQFKHKHFVRIKPGATKTKKIRLKVDFGKALKAVSKRPKNITIKAKVYMTIMIGTIDLKTPFAFEVKKTFPIPWKQIETQVKRQGGKIFNNLKKKNFRKFFR